MDVIRLYGERLGLTQTLKGQSNEILDPQFISSFKPIWAPDKQAKVFSNFVSISLRYSNFSIEKSALIKA